LVANYASGSAGATQVVEAITGAGGRAVAVPGDVSRADEAKAIVDTAVSTYGRLDILVNNAGVYEFGLLEAVTEAQFDKMFGINVLGLLLVTTSISGAIGWIL
jgi:3-oxoacyl-[acyl-carrier protein] reductase